MTRTKTNRHPVLTTLKRELIERLQARYPGRSLGGIVREIVEAHAKQIAKMQTTLITRTNQPPQTEQTK